jgi:hypothetical protein
MSTSEVKMLWGGIVSAPFAMRFILQNSFNPKTKAARLKPGRRDSYNSPTAQT